MGKDPGFIFYPGDYLRDTQTMSEKTQVAYDRIMCEHMRNISISERQLKFFTKRLNEEEIDELKFVLTKINGGYQIDWVAESIVKRKAYSDSRRKNRAGDLDKKTENISDTYDTHKENENENKNIDINNINIREQNFKNEVYSMKMFPAPMLKEFFEYWSEPNRSGKKMKWELEKTWDLKRRLTRWFANYRPAAPISIKPKTATRHGGIGTIAEIYKNTKP